MESYSHRNRDHINMHDPVPYWETKLAGWGLLMILQIWTKAQLGFKMGDWVLDWRGKSAFITQT